jgi:hypothetical protein
MSFLIKREAIILYMIVTAVAAAGSAAWFGYSLSGLLIN